jgi:hypothetical protein
MTFNKATAKRIITIVGGSVAVLAGLRDLGQRRNDGSLLVLRSLLRIGLAAVAVAIALQATDEIIEEVM